MAVKVVVYHKKAEVSYDVTRQEDGVYCLRISGDSNVGESYIPQKLIIRRKGKIWISDAEDYPELVGQLTEEVKQFSVTNER